MVLWKAGEGDSKGPENERFMKQADQREQFEAIFERHGDFLKACLWKLTGDTDRFADAWQNVLIAVWRHLVKINDRNARAYLYRVVLSSASRAWRTRPGAVDSLPDVLICPDKGPLEQTQDREITDTVRREIARLPLQQGQAVILRYLENSEYSQIACALDCTEAAARSHVSKALAGLRKRLRRLFDKEPCHDQT